MSCMRDGTCRIKAGFASGTPRSTYFVTRQLIAALTGNLRHFQGTNGTDCHTAQVLRQHDGLDEWQWQRRVPITNAKTMTQRMATQRTATQRTATQRTTRKSLKGRRGRGRGIRNGVSRTPKHPQRGDQQLLVARLQRGSVAQPCLRIILGRGQGAIDIVFQPVCAP